MSRNLVPAVVTLIAVFLVTVSVVSSSSSVVVHGTSSESVPGVCLKAGLAAVMATTIGVLSDLVTAVCGISSDNRSSCTSFSSSSEVGTVRTGVSQDSSALGDVNSVAFKSTATILVSTSYINY